jgi:dihydropteroate synthase
MLETRSTLNCKGKLLSLKTPVVMGILNVTPDSFYDGGKYQQADNLLRQAEKMLDEGATILDLGGMSSRPSATLISVEEELKRVLPAIELILKKVSETIISIDTVQAEVVKQSIEAGASIVNDISAGRMDEALYPTLAALQVPYVLMHMQGTPQNMQQQPVYEDVVREVLDFFILEIGKLRSLGIKDIILDVGFGFGKTLQHNYQLLKNLHVFKILELPMLTGISRKSMVYKPYNGSAKTALNGTSALHMIALQQGSKLLRAHDVKEAVEVIKLWKQLEES